MEFEHPYAQCSLAYKGCHWSHKWTNGGWAAPVLTGGGGGKGVATSATFFGSLPQGYLTSQHMVFGYLSGCVPGVNPYLHCSMPNLECLLLRQWLLHTPEVLLLPGLIRRVQALFLETEVWLITMLDWGGRTQLCWFLCGAEHEQVADGLSHLTVAGGHYLDTPPRTCPQGVCLCSAAGWLWSLPWRGHHAHWHMTCTLIWRDLQWWQLLALTWCPPTTESTTPLTACLGMARGRMERLSHHGTWTFRNLTSPYPYHNVPSQSVPRLLHTGYEGAGVRSVWYPSPQ